MLLGLFSCVIQAQYVLRHMGMVYALLWFGDSPFYPYPSGLLHWHWGNLMIAPVPVKQPWKIWVNRSHESIRSSWYNHNKTKHSKTQQNYVYILWDVFQLHHLKLPVRSHAQHFVSYSFHCYVCIFNFTRCIWRAMLWLNWWTRLIGSFLFRMLFQFLMLFSF